MISRRSLLKGLAALPALLVVPWRKPVDLFAIKSGKVVVAQTPKLKLYPPPNGVDLDDYAIPYRRRGRPPLKHADVVKAAKEIRGLNRERGETLTWKLNERAYREIFG